MIREAINYEKSLARCEKSSVRRENGGSKIEDYGGMNAKAWKIPARIMGHLPNASWRGILFAQGTTAFGAVGQLKSSAW